MNIGQAISTLQEKDYKPEQIDRFVSGQMNPDEIKEIYNIFEADGHPKVEITQFINTLLEADAPITKKSRKDPAQEMAAQKPAEPFFFKQPADFKSDEEYIQDPTDTMDFELVQLLPDPENPGQKKKTKVTITAYFGELPLEDTMRVSAKVPYWGEYLGYGVKDFLGQKWSMIDLMHMCMILVQRAVADYDLEKNEPRGFGLSVLHELHLLTGLSIPQMRALKNSQIYRLVIKLFEVNSPFFVEVWQKAGPIKEAYSFLAMMYGSWKEQQKAKFENALFDGIYRGSEKREIPLSSPEPSETPSPDAPTGGTDPGGLITSTPQS